MKKTDRAKQFAPFDALKGFREAILEKEKIIVPKKELSEDLQEELDRIISSLVIGAIVTITFYDGEQYKQVSGAVSKISKTYRSLVVDATNIQFNDIYKIEV